MTSGKEVLAEADVFLLLESEDVEWSQFLKPIVDDTLRAAIPHLEATFRRQIWRDGRDLFAASADVTMGDPESRYRRVFALAYARLGVEGASLFLKPPSYPDEDLQLVATVPRSFPATPPIYPSDQPTPTLECVKRRGACLIGDVDAFRDRLRDCGDPVWCDIEDEDRLRTMLLVFYATREDAHYVLRLTNSNKNPSRYFHELDIQRACDFVVLLAFLHQAGEHAYRGMKFFLDAAHDFRQKMQGALSAANSARILMSRACGSSGDVYEANLKMVHIATMAKEISDELEGLIPSGGTADRQGSEDARVGFRPYADLVRPVCETFSRAARERRIEFAYSGIDQLGRVFGPIGKIRRVVENVVRNAVKYTYERGKIQVALSRREGGGGYIYIASKSLPIGPDERDRVFDYGFRSAAVRDSEADGHGLGLSTSLAIMRELGGDILLRVDRDVNIFAIVLPSILFRPPGSASRIAAEKEGV
ncbi:MAG: HAMP domain-containing histidine kinase [Chloroflexi bacterium]|nr:HAMP domain-containing histidine kinase [Chloroflexota bacterium]